MPRQFTTLLLFTLLLTAASMTARARAEDSLLFASTFAAGSSGSIHTLRFDHATGELTRVTQMTGISNPFFLTVTHDGRFLYAIDSARFGDDENEFIAACRIDATTGQLTLLNRQSAMGRTSCYLDVDATSKTVVVANYSSGDVAALPVRPDGSLDAARSFIRHTGSSIHATRQKKPFAHCIEISPDGRFALAADLGTDRIQIYRLDTATSQLTPASKQPFATVTAGSGPRHLTFHPNGQRVYVINELKNTVTFFDYEATTGMLTERQTISTLPEDFTDTSHCADLKITPDGRFLYGTNRGHDSIAVFSIGTDGRLTLTEITPSQGKGPQNLLITPNGRWLLCANMPGDVIAVFAIDAETGSLTGAGSPFHITRPSCMQWLP